MAFAAQQLNPKIRFRCFVVKENSAQDLGRKKEKTLSQPKVGW